MDAMKILGGLLGGGMGGGGLFGGAPAAGASSSGGGLMDALGGLLGGGSGGSAGGGDMLSALGGLLGGGGSKSSGGSSAMPLLGLALTAATHFLSKQGGAGGLSQLLGGGEGAETAVPEYTHQPEVDQDAIILIKAMIAAAYSDGRLDEQERTKIVERLESMDLDDDERSFVNEELASPGTAEEIVSVVQTREQAWQAYAVSLVSINVDTWEEKAFLLDLAEGLGLSAEDQANIAEQLGVGQAQQSYDEEKNIER